MQPKRIGILGGTFNPVHNGHLFLATYCRDRLALDRLDLVTAAAPPHKTKAGLAPAHHRHAMTALAVKGHPGLRANPIELKLDPPSYTVNTLRAYSESEGDARLFFIIGADTVAELPGWHQLPECLALATLVTMTRPGAPTHYNADSFPHLTSHQVDQLNAQFLAMPLRPENATDIRRKIKRGECCDDWLPADVAIYIRQHKLYNS